MNVFGVFATVSLQSDLELIWDRFELWLLLKSVNRFHKRILCTQMSTYVSFKLESIVPLFASRSVDICRMYFSWPKVVIYTYKKRLSHSLIALNWNNEVSLVFLNLCSSLILPFVCFIFAQLQIVGAITKFHSKFLMCNKFSRPCKILFVFI